MSFIASAAIEVLLDLTILTPRKLVRSELGLLLRGGERVISWIVLGFPILPFASFGFLIAHWRFIWYDFAAALFIRSVIIRSQLFASHFARVNYGAPSNLEGLDIIIHECESLRFFPYKFLSNRFLMISIKIIKIPESRIALYLIVFIKHFQLGRHLFGRITWSFLLAAQYLWILTGGLNPTLCIYSLWLSTWLRVRSVF